MRRDHQRSKVEQAADLCTVHTNPYISHPVNLERWLMEGSYSKVWAARTRTPMDEYRYFVDVLVDTIRSVSVRHARNWPATDEEEQKRNRLVRGKGLPHPPHHRRRDAALLQVDARGHGVRAAGLSLGPAHIFRSMLIP